MEFVAIDFETANASRNSACSIGIVTIKDGEITNEYYSLLKPPLMKFMPMNTRIHGIDADMVEDAPTFKEIWPEVKKRIKEKIVVAHNASFDIGVLESCLDTYGLRSVNYDYFCTVKMAQCVFPGLPNHKLNTVARLCGWTLEHHHALSDSRACAQIANLCYPLYSKRSGHNAIISWEDTDDYYYEDIERKDTSFETIDMLGLAEDDERFKGMHFVFTGHMNAITRSEAIKAVTDQGGEVKNHISRKTKYLVADKQIIRGILEPTGKYKKARALIESGNKKLRIIDEDKFIKMLK